MIRRFLMWFDRRIDARIAADAEAVRRGVISLDTARRRRGLNELSTKTHDAGEAA